MGTVKMRTKETKSILVENVDSKLWRKFVGIARYSGMKTGDLLNDVLMVFVERQKLRGCKGGGVE